MLAMQEILWNPAQIQPESPAIAKVNDGNGHHAPDEAHPWNLLRQRHRRGKLLQFFRRYAGVVSRKLRERHGPQYNPQKTEQRASEEGASPSGGGHDHDDRARRRRVADSGGGVGDP